jgi:CRISPR/Cas system-associated exonuclease Cas4 (RecB family)
MKEVKKYQPKKLKESDMAVFRIGNVFHDEIQSAFRWLIDEKHKDNPDIEFVMENKVLVDLYGLEIEGHYDLKILDHKNKIVQLLDVKTMNPRAMSFFKKDPYSKTGYIIQLGTYAIPVKEKHSDYELSLLLSAWDKDKGQFHEVEIDPDRAILSANNYYKNLAETMKMEVDEIIPLQHPFAPIEPKWECDYCQYNHICNSPKIKRI